MPKGILTGVIVAAVVAAVKALFVAVVAAVVAVIVAVIAAVVVAVVFGIYFALLRRVASRRSAAIALMFYASAGQFGQVSEWITLCKNEESYTTV